LDFVRFPNSLDAGKKSAAGGMAAGSGGMKKEQIRGKDGRPFGLRGVRLCGNVNCQLVPLICSTEEQRVFLMAVG